MSITVTAAQSGTTFHGMLLRVDVLTSAGLAATPATAVQSSSAAAAHQASITTTVTGSKVYGALVTAGSTLFGAAAGTTLTDNFQDSPNGAFYGSCVTTSATGTPGATVVGAATPTSKAGGCALLEVLASGGSITLDGSSPAVATTTSLTTVTTAAFTPPAGSLLVAMVSSDASTATTVTVSGGGLTWTQQVVAQTAGALYAAVWTATIPAAAGNQSRAIRARLPQPATPRGRVYSSPGSVPPVAASGSAKALQRSAADKLAYLYDGSLIFGYWDGSQGQAGHITSPLAPLSVTNLISTAEDGISIWVDNSAGTSSDIWVCSSDDDASGAGPSLHVRHGTYTGGAFTWDAATLISGTTTAATIQSSITWNGTCLMVFWWDGTSGSDRVEYAWTSTKNGTSGWSAAAVFSESATWSTVVQVCARHSAKLAATVVAYGGNSQMHYAVLADSAASPAIGNWGGRAVFDQFDDSLAVFGGPQVVIDESSGVIHVVRAVVNSGGPSWDGVIYWMGTYTAGAPGSVSFAARVTVASGATGTGPADIAAAVDVTGTVWVLWTDNTTAGNLKYATVTAPFTSASAAVTLIAGGASSNPRWPHVPAVSASAGGLAAVLPVLYMDTTGSPYPVLLNTSVALPAPGPVFRQASQAVRALLPQQPVLRGREMYGPGTPARNPAPGPVFRQQVQAVRAKLPGQPVLRGRVVSSPGIPPRNPSPGPVFRQKPAPVRVALPPWQPRAGRVGSSFGAPVANPAHGPPAYAPPGPSRARLPQLAPRAGRVTSNPGTAPRNPAGGPAAPPLQRPVRAPVPRTFSRGRAGSDAGAQVRNPASGSVVYAAEGPARSRTAPPFSRGRTSSSPGAPVQDPARGPVFRQAARPVAARLPVPFLKGRAAGSPGVLPVLGSGPVFRPFLQAARSALPVPVLKGRVSRDAGVPARNPGRGPAVAPQRGPVQSRVPLPAPGRTAGTRAAAVIPPPPPPAPVFPLHSPVRALVPRVFSKGRVITGNPGGPVRNPHAGPPVYPPRGPAGLAYRAPGPFRKGSAQSGSIESPPRSFTPVLLDAGDARWAWETGSARQAWGTGAARNT